MVINDIIILSYEEIRKAVMNGKNRFVVEF